MDPVTALPAGEVEEEHNEKKPVLKKVKDKVKKLKNAITKKSQGHGDGGDDQQRHGDVDEGDEGFVEDDEMIVDPEVHGAPSHETSAASFGPKGTGDGSSINQNRSLLNPEIETNQEKYGRPEFGGIGAKENLGGEDVEGVGDNLPLTTEKFVGDLSPPSTEAERNKEIEHNREYERPATQAEGEEKIGSGLSMIKENTVEDLDNPWKGSKVHADDQNQRFPLYNNSPATDARSGANEANTIFERSQVHLSPTAPKSEADLGVITMELVEDPAAPKTESEKKTITENCGEEVEISPELSRSFEAMAVAAQNDRAETELSQGTNNSYTDMVSSAASKVYEMVADAGTSVVSKVKPDATSQSQGKGISIKEYITEKLTPGEDEKALSELITDAGQKKKNETVEIPLQESGKGVGIVEKIRETVTSFLGGGGGGEGSPKSPRKEAEYSNDRQPPEGVSFEKESSEELPSSYH